jgi:hypothetical protein
MYRIEDNVYAAARPPYGKSLFARRAFKKNDLVFVAQGAVVLAPTDYTIPIDWHAYLEPRVPEGNLCQYICHSCEPNLGVRDRTLFVAFRDIAAGEELTIDYAMFGYEYGSELPEEKRVCSCGTPSCRGKLGCYKELSQDKKEAYAGYISDYLLHPQKD